MSWAASRVVTLPRMKRLAGGRLQPGDRDRDQPGEHGGKDRQPAPHAAAALWPQV